MSTLDDKRPIGCIVCGGRTRTISEDGDQECVVSPDHGYDDLVPPPVLIEVTAADVEDSLICRRVHGG